MRLIRVLLAFITIFFMANLAFGSENVESAVRAPNEPWQEAASRNRGSDFSVLVATTPEAFAVPLEQLPGELAHLPEWPGPIASIRAPFEHARDERYYQDGSHDFFRRSSWMYPDDGCFARAGHVAASLERAGVVRPGRVFAFGNLKLKTEFNPRGAVFWWYHVAAAYRSGNLVVVLDPAVDHDRPMLVEEWVKAIAKNPATTKVALCDTHAYMAGQACRGGGPGQERGQVSHQKGYLRSEFKRLGRLGMNAESVLRVNTIWGPQVAYDLPFALYRPASATR